MDNLLQFEWVGGEPQTAASSTAQGLFPSPAHRTSEEERDYESLTMMKLRQAQERKELAEQLKEDQS